MGASKPNFIVIAPNYFNYATSTVKAIRQLGYNVKFFAEKPFYLNCSYLQRKLFKTKWSHYGSINKPSRMVRLRSLNRASD